MTTTNKKIALFAGFVAGLAGGVWVTTDLSRSPAVDLRQFDPEEAAQTETAMWRSYYDKERVQLFNGLALLLRRQYHMPFLRSYLTAYHGAKAAFVFQGGHDRTDYERTLPDVIAYYTAIRRSSMNAFDVDRTAKLELEWWIVHRERNQHPSGDLDHALADLAGAIYQQPSERFNEHGHFRAEAMLLRDHLSQRSAVTDADWEAIHQLLRKSWGALWRAVNDRVTASPPS